MKKIKISLSLAIVALVSCFFASCSDYDDEDCSCPDSYYYNMSYQPMDSALVVINTPYYEYNERIGAENFLKKCGEGSILNFTYSSEGFCIYSPYNCKNTYKPNASYTAFEGEVVFHGLKNMCDTYIWARAQDTIGYSGYANFPFCRLRVEIDEEALAKAVFRGVQDAKTANIECSFDIPEKYVPEYKFLLLVSSSEESLSGDKVGNAVSALDVTPDVKGKAVVNIASLLKSGEKVYYRPVIVANETQEMYKGKIMSLTGK